MDFTKSYLGLKLQTFAYFVTLKVALFRVVSAVGIGGFFNVESVNTLIMNSSKRQPTPWTKSIGRKKIDRAEEKGERPTFRSKQEEVTRH